MSISTNPFLPTYLALAANINDFTRFADGGSDASWYVGYNNAWIIRLPAAPAGEFSRAFIGAKLGRAKTRPSENRPWVREVISGKVYMAVSPTPAFNAKQTFFLTDASDIPAEPDPSASVEGIGASEWFWAEVPLDRVSFTGPNYLIVWSAAEYFQSASSSPILAAASVDTSIPQETSAWNNRSISGVPPRKGANALQTAINNISPAMAVKLVPAVTSEVTVTDITARRLAAKYIVQFSAGGENLAEAWVETSQDQLDWTRSSRFLRKPPYVFTLNPAKLPPAAGYVRGVARDICGNTGHSIPVPLPYGPL
ncbi:MAG: hypothetical protein HY748_14915 [Elusimicrobia bacterium]|nr:hypothetical protein [Elusimicrobiota bacterium]